MVGGGLMFHASRRRDFRASGVLEAPPAEKSEDPKCTEIKVKLNGGQHVCYSEEKPPHGAFSGE